METRRAIKEAAEKLSIDEWIEAIGQSLLEPRSVEDIPLPGAPSPDLQAAYVGSAGPTAIREAALFYRYVLDANEKHRGGPMATLLDFGCGWGRYTRLFAREVPEEGLYGADPDPLAIRVCRLHVPYGCFVLSTTRPPLPFRDQFFDVVIAYSVFSHLSELNAANWIYELSRVLKPGGLLVATTHGPWLLDRVQSLQDGVVPCTTTWEHRLVRSWKDPMATRARYERGEFIFSETGEYAERDGYGDALVPKRYVWEVWGKLMEPLQYVSDPTAVSQTAFVLRRCR